MSMASRKKTHLVTDPAIWRVLIAPVRYEIAEAVLGIGPCSIAEIGAAIDRPADALYRHVAQLIAAGLLVEAGVRQVGRRAERLVDCPADDYSVGFGTPGKAPAKAERDALVETVNSFCKGIGKTVRTTALAGGLRLSSEDRNISVNYEVSYLTAAQYERVRALMRRIKALMDAGRVARKGTLYSTLAVATPVMRKRGATRDSARDEAGDGARVATPRAIDPTSPEVNAARAPRQQIASAKPERRANRKSS